MFFTDFFRERTPFDVEGELMNISTGIRAFDNVNVDDAFAVGEHILQDMSGKSVSQHTFKKKHQAVTMSTAKNTLKVKDEVLQINPGLLFQRLASVAAKFPECLERSLEYELCQFPPSLFASPQCLRQTNKSQLADALKKMINPPNEMMDVDLQYVIDGGSL